MRAALVFAVAAAAVVVAFPAAAGAPPNGCTYKRGTIGGVFNCPWKSAPYYDNQYGILRLSTNPNADPKCGWTGGMAPVTNDEKYDWRKEGWACYPWFVWAKTCKGAPQTVEFKKKIFVPGHPADLKVSFVSYKNRPLTMALEINGTSALTTHHTVHEKDLKAEHLFKWGWNTLTVHAQKGLTGKQPCNQGTPEYGFYVQIRAVFRADIVATIDPPNPSGVFIQFVTVKNDGPSGVPAFRVGVGTTTNKLKVVAPGTDPNAAVIISAEGPRGSPLPNCNYYSAGGYSTDCNIYETLLPGESRRFAVRYYYTPPPTGNFYDEFTESWYGVGDGNDPNQANNGGKRLRGACRQAAPPPCVKPKP